MRAISCSLYNTAKSIDLLQLNTLAVKYSNYVFSYLPKSMATVQESKQVAGYLPTLRLPTLL